MNFTNIEDLHKYVISECKNIHPNDLDILFISGSTVRGTSTTYSDIDYTACVSEKYSHSLFKFFVCKVAGIPRLVSIYFFQTHEISITQDQMTEDYYLWTKKMMQKGKAEFVHGNKALFDKIIDFNIRSTFAKEPNVRAIHRSTGKLLELLIKLRKYYDQNNLQQMIYYGMKLSEHSKKILLEYNQPLSLNSESEMFETIIHLKNKPRCFSKLYSIISRLTGKGISTKEYFLVTYEFVSELLAFVKENIIEEDVFTQALFDSPVQLVMDHLLVGIDNEYR